MEFSEALVGLNISATSSKEVIHFLAGKLYEQGFVSADYGDMTFKRELDHPTGLPTKPFCIAFPHADSHGVFRSALAVAILSKPVKFKNMADPDEDLNVEIVLMLANKSPEEQIETLRNLSLLFGQPDKLSALRDQKSPGQAASWLMQELGLDTTSTTQYQDSGKEERIRREDSEEQ